MEQELFNNIKALGLLLSYASSIKKNIETQKYSEDDKLWIKAKAFDKYICEQINFSIFQPLQPDQQTEYEFFVSKMISGILNNLPKKYINDEINILKNAQLVDCNSLDNLEFDFIDNLDKFIGRELDKDRIVDLIRKCDKLAAVTADSIFMISQTYFEDIDNNYILIAMLAQNKDKKRLTIASFFFLEFRKYEKYDESPVMLFLKCLDFFGLDIRLDDYVARYFYKIEVPYLKNSEIPFFLNVENYIGPYYLYLIATSNESMDKVLITNSFAIRVDLYKEHLEKVHYLK